MSITKTKIGDFFIWLSGADAKLIEESGLLSRAERTKYIGLGTTVAIPAFISFFASSYAASTVIEYPYVYLLVGFIWSLIILSIDRLLVSTLYKSMQHSNVKFYAGLMARVVIAMVLGVVMSHPMTLFIFRASIQTEVETLHEDEYQARVLERKQEQEDSLEYQQLLVEGERLRIQFNTIARERSLLNCLYELRTNEASGVPLESTYSYEGIDGVVVEQSCGISSGRSGQNQRYADLLTQANNVALGIEMQDAKYQEDKALFDGNMSKFNEELAIQTERIEKNTSIDYLARVNALNSLLQKNGHVRSVYFMLLLTLVLLDCMLVIIKAILPIGNYEMIKDSHLAQNQVEYDHALAASKELKDAELEELKKLYPIKAHLDVIGQYNKMYIDDTFKILEFYISKQSAAVELCMGDVDTYTKMLDSFQKKIEDINARFKDKELSDAAIAHINALRIEYEEILKKISKAATDKLKDLNWNKFE